MTRRLYLKWGCQAIDTRGTVPSRNTKNSPLEEFFVFSKE